jgi:integrase/recombinase XerD
MMSKLNLIGPWIKRFLMEHLVQERNLAVNTQTSYRDTFVLLLPFCAAHAGVQVDKLLTDHLSSEVIRLFLRHLEDTRKCSVQTRNQRLAAIHALARFVGNNSPEQVAWCGEICSVPFKKATKPRMSYLEKHEMDALLDAPNRATSGGDRDYALLLFLYNTGARASEAAGVTIGDLQLGKAPSIRIKGKGGKIRYCPLWRLTASALEVLISGRRSHERIFLNHRKQPITRFGIHALVRRYVRKAGDRVSSLLDKGISVHSIRHSTAVHLLRAGVDINTIRAWLGHVSLDTTNIYAEVDLQMKARALSHCEILTAVTTDSTWENKPELIKFLKSL